MNSDMVCKPESTLTSRWHAKFGWLDWLGVGVAVLFFSRVALDEDLTWMGWAMVGLLLILLTVTQWPYGALVVLVGMSAMPRFFVELFGWKARPEHFAVVIVSLAVCIWLLRSNRAIRLETPDYWVLAYIAINYVSSAFGSSSRSETLRWALLNNLVVLPYFLIRLLVRDAETFRKAFRIFLVVGIAESTYGILCFLAHQALGTTAGMELSYLTYIYAPYGSLAEPNLFGAYAGCATVLALAMYFAERRLSYLICFFVGAIATVLSFSRAALIALVIAAGWVCWQSRFGRESRRSRSLTLVLAVGMILLIVVPAVGGVVQERFGSLFTVGRLGEESAIGRLIEAQEAVMEFLEHPLIGTGTASFQLSFDWGKYVPALSGYQTWVGNITVRILHDTGLLGMAAFLGFLGSLGWKIRFGLRGRSSQVAMLVALAAGALLYAISFQATDGTLSAFPWVHMGFLASAAILVNESANAVKAPPVRGAIWQSPFVRARSVSDSGRFGVQP
jgi:O-antigen ligase